LVERRTLPPEFRTGPLHRTLNEMPRLIAAIRNLFATSTERKAYRTILPAR